MNDPPVRVVSQHSTIRDLFPFYSLDMLLFGALLMVTTYVLMRWLDPPTANFVTLGGYLGMAFVNWTAKPSFLRIQKHQEAMLVSTLEQLTYRYVPTRDHWVPPLPRWLRWKYNFVKFSPDRSEVRVVGPANILRYLAAQLS